MTVYIPRASGPLTNGCASSGGFMIKLTERPEGASVQLRKNETTPEGVAHTLPGGQLNSN